MRKILREGHTKARAMKELILQPQSDWPFFRRFLREEGYQTIQENMIYEDGKYYPMVKVVPVDAAEVSVASTEEEQELWDVFGELLLKGKNTVLRQYLDFSEKHVENLLQHLRTQGGTRAEERVVELEKELCILQKAKAYVEDFSSGTEKEE